MPRKTTGCWTCRFRKKRCDDGRPSCSSCTLREIPCYGYGAKPQWKDGGESERATMEDIRRQVKESYRRRRTRNSTGRPREPHQDRRSSIAPSTGSPTHPGWPQDGSIPSDASGDPPSLRQDDDRPNRDRLEAYTVQVDSGPGTRNARTEEHFHSYQYSVSASPRTEPGYRIPFDETEINLLVYYLDHIFPRLAPYFKYSAADNGRGWLFNLFLRSRPLCTAAVCISGCDKAQFVLGPLSELPQPYHELEMQHLQSVADIRDHLDQLSKKTGASQMAAGVEALACIMHLIFFELWIPRKGLMNDWVMHLDAASVLLSSLDAAAYEAGGASSVTPASDLSPLHNYDLDHKPQWNIPTELLSEGENSAFEFFLGWYTYCFINATASLGLTAQSAQSISRIRALYPPSQNKLKDMYGCEDWVMHTLLDIAILKDWKQMQSTAGTLSLRELNRRAGIIEDRLQGGVAKFAQPLPDSESRVEEEKRIVTNAYVNAALVFLHVVVSGFWPKIPEIQQSVLATLQALEYHRAHAERNFASWPFCVAGCLAVEAQYPRFRALVPPIEKGKHPLVLSIWTLQILEECWKTRASQPEGEETCSWTTAMNHLGTRLLLL